MSEKTLIIVKHDGVARGLIGEVIARFERVGLKIVAMEFIQSTEEMGDSHYPVSEKWFTKVGERTLKEYQERGLDATLILGTNNAMDIGKLVKKWLIEYLNFGPVMAMVFEGPNAVLTGRKLAGDTIPAIAVPGTIRGDFGTDSVEFANEQKRPLYNIIHASGEVAEAQEEISLWFGNQELFDYDVLSAHFSGVKGRMSRD